MAVLIGTGSGFELVDRADVEDVALGHGLRPGPRVLRRFDVGEPRRPAGRPRPVSVLSLSTRLESAACRVRPVRHPVLQLFGIGVLVALTVICLGLLYLHSSEAGVAGVPEQTVVVRVQEGDTVWSVAERWAPGSDSAAVVARIVELNGLVDSEVAPGQPLVVPDGRADLAR